MGAWSSVFYNYNFNVIDPKHYMPAFGVFALVKNLILLTVVHHVLLLLLPMCHAQIQKTVQCFGVLQGLILTFLEVTSLKFMEEMILMPSKWRLPVTSGSNVVKKGGNALVTPSEEPFVIFTTFTM